MLTGRLTPLDDEGSRIKTLKVKRQNIQLRFLILIGEIL